MVAFILAFAIENHKMSRKEPETRPPLTTKPPHSWDTYLVHDPKVGRGTRQ